MSFFGCAPETSSRQRSTRQGEHCDSQNQIQPRHLKSAAADRPEGEPRGGKRTINYCHALVSVQCVTLINCPFLGARPTCTAARQGSTRQGEHSQCSCRAVTPRSAAQRCHSNVCRRRPSSTPQPTAEKQFRKNTDFEILCGNTPIRVVLPRSSDVSCTNKNF